MKFTYMIFSWFMIFKNTYIIKFYPQLQFGQQPYYRLVLTTKWTEVDFHQWKQIFILYVLKSYDMSMYDIQMKCNLYLNP